MNRRATTLEWWWFPVAFLAVGVVAGVLAGFTAGNALTSTRITHTRITAPDRIRTLGQLASHLGKPSESFAGKSLNTAFSGSSCEAWVVVNYHLAVVACWK